MSIDIILEKIKNKDPDIIYLQNISQDMYYENDLQDDKILEHRYDNIFGKPVKSVIFKHEIIIVDSWNKNMVYNYLDKIHFPNAKTIIMNSHPCEYSTLTRSPDWHWIALNNHRWFAYFDNIEMILNYEEYLKILSIILTVDKKYTIDFKGKLILCSSINKFLNYTKSIFKN